jgi:hypothetical protein
VSAEVKSGLKRFPADPKLCMDVTEDELMFLKGVRLRGKRPTPLYYSRELQNLRGSLNFLPSPEGDR